MPKVKPERIAGIVAMSYLVLIPTAALLAWRKIQIMQEDVDILWDNSGLKNEPRKPLIDVSKLTQGFRSR